MAGASLPKPNPHNIRWLSSYTAKRTAASENTIGNIRYDAAAKDTGTMDLGKHHITPTHGIAKVIACALNGITICQLHKVEHGIGIEPKWLQMCSIGSQSSGMVNKKNEAYQRIFRTQS